MTKQDLEFIKKSNKFIVIKNNNRTDFNDFSDAVKFYNENVKEAHEIELNAICGIVGKTIAYKYNQKGTAKYGNNWN